MKRFKEEKPFQILQLANPVYAYLEMTYACEGRCPGCPALSAPDRSSIMAGSQWSAIMRELSTTVDEVRLTGGEPTGHPDFLSILDALRTIELPFRIYTNGLWPETRDMLKIVKNNQRFRGFVISLHGSTAETHDFFSGIPLFEKVISAIEKAVHRGIPVYTSTVLGAFNQHDIEGIMTLAARIGSRKHFFQRYMGPFRKCVSLFRENMLSLLKRIANIPPRVFSYRVGECFPRCFFNGASPCLAGITHITLTPTGAVKACPFSAEIQGAWKNGRISGRKKLLQWTENIHEDCLACDLISSCMGGCRSLRECLNLSRDPLMEEPLIGSGNPEEIAEEKPILIDGCARLICKVRKEKSGPLLIRDGEVIPLTDRACSILELCDGTLSIAEIGQEAGVEVREFLLSLYLRGFLEFI